jgi:uncharacterized protein (TIGR04255 family)
MAQIRHLNRAPIAEAVIELRIRAGNGVPLELLDKLVERWKSDYPTASKVESLAATLGIQQGRPLTDTQYQQLGLLAKSANAQRAVQFRIDAFAFSRLSPYSSWEQVRPEALRLWGSYRETVRPDLVTRVGVRYINRLRLPLPVDLTAYFTSAPIVPEMLPQTLRSYLTRKVLHDRDTGNSVTVTQASEPSSDPDHIVVLLDVDAFREVDLDSSRFSEIDSVLESLRDLKNRAFFGSITERTVEMYA